MDAVFEAIAWNVNRKSYRLPAKVTMPSIQAMITAYNEELDKRSARVNQPRDTASHVPNSRATIYRNIGRADVVLIETARYLRSHDRSVPPQLEEYLDSIPGGEEAVSVSLRWNNDTPIAQLRAVHASALQQARPRDVAKISAHYAVMVLQQSTRTADHLAEALAVSVTGYEAAHTSAKPVLHSEAMDCARAAAWACVLLSRIAITKRDEKSNRECLTEVQRWKVREAEAADALRLPMTAAVARFHAERARGLLINDIVGEMRALRTVAQTLVDQHQNESNTATDTVRYHDLTVIIQRLCATDWAYTGAKDFGDAVATIFPEGIPVIVETLMTIYSSDDRGRQAMSDVRALLRLKQINDRILDSYPLGLPDLGRLERIIADVDVLDFLRVFDSQALQALALANYATAFFDYQTRGFTSHVHEPIVDPVNLVVTAYDYCRLARVATRDRGSGQALLVQLSAAVRKLDERVPGIDRAEVRTGRQFFPTAARVRMDELVMLALTSRRMKQADLTQVTNSADAIHRYLIGHREGFDQEGLRGIT